MDLIQKDYENDPKMCAIFIFKQLNLLLSFNNRSMFQRTINYKIQQLKILELGKNFRLVCFCYEIMHLHQLKNYNKLMSLKNEIES